MRDRHLTDEEDEAIRDGNRGLQMRAGARNAAWEDVTAAVDAVAVADREADSQAYRCGVLVRLGAPRSLADRFMEPFWAMMSPLVVDYGDTPLGRRMTRDSELYLGAARSMPKSEARKRLEEREPAPMDRLTLPCFLCGRTAGEGEVLVDITCQDAVKCIDAKACLERVQAAKACLEPVPA